MKFNFKINEMALVCLLAFIAIVWLVMLPPKNIEVHHMKPLFKAKPAKTVAPPIVRPVSTPYPPAESNDDFRVRQRY